MNNNEVVKTDRLRIAKISYLERIGNDRMGAYIDVPEGYVFLYSIGNVYVNLFNPVLDLPVYDRTNYSNTASNGEDYGTLITHVSGDIKSGACYILEKGTLKDILDIDEISIGTLKEYMYKSKLFFVDRESNLKEEDYKTRRKYKSIVNSDNVSYTNLVNYLNNKEKVKKI